MPRASVVGIFGKHPAWPDHLALPLQSATLAQLRRRLYDGIRAAVERGTWSDPAAGRVIPFGHTFCATAMGDETGWVVGRLWESSDAIGRREYPLVACVHVYDVDCVAAFALAVPVLRQLESTCRTAASQAEVLAALSDAQAAVAAHLTAVATIDPPAPGATKPRDWLAALLVLVKKELRRIRFHGRPARTKGLRLHRRHFSADAALCRWASPARRRLPQRTAIFAACADSGTWIDLVSGELTKDAVGRLRLVALAANSP